MGWWDYDRSDAPTGIEASALETARFGRRVGRVLLPRGVESLDLIGWMSDELADFDIVVVRYLAEHTGWFASFDSSSHQAIHADTLQYWARVIPPEPAPPVRSVDELRLAPATTADLSLVATLTADIFEDYGNHYSANPLISPTDSLAGYVEWAQVLVDRPGADVLIQYRGDDAVALAALESSDGITEVALAGVDPRARGRGAYAALLAGVEDWAGRSGRARVVISTQAHNVAPMRAWARAGYLPEFTVETIHLVRRDLLESVAPLVHRPSGLTAARPRGRSTPRS